METNNYIKVMGVFLMGWALSGFGLTHILEVQNSEKQTQTTINRTLPLTLSISLVDASENVAITSGFRIEMTQCTVQRPFGGNTYSCQPIKDEAKNSVGNTPIKQSQYTNAEGMATFTVNYPDKYTAPTTHFHISVYDRFNNLVTSSQFDFPPTVYPSMDAYYKAGGKDPIKILTDDPTSNPPLLVTGNITAGFRAARTIFIPGNAATTTSETNDYGQVSELKIFPNPVVNTTTFAFHLTQTSEVAISVIDMSGTQIRTVYNQNLRAGQHEIEVDLGILPKGVYQYRLEVSNQDGTFSEAKKLIKA